MIITASISETRRLWTIWHIWLWSKWEEVKVRNVLCVRKGKTLAKWSLWWCHYKQALTSHIINNRSLVSNVIMHCMNCNWATHTHTHRQSPSPSYLRIAESTGVWPRSKVVSQSPSVTHWSQGFTHLLSSFPLVACSGSWANLPRGPNCDISSWGWIAPCRR